VRVSARGRTLRFGRLDRNGPFRRICVADSQTKSLMTAPPRGAVESADRSLYNCFEQFHMSCANGICFNANPLYSGSNVGQRAFQRLWENDPSRTCRSIGSQPGGRWTWKSARNWPRPMRTTIKLVRSRRAGCTLKCLPGLASDGSGDQRLSLQLFSWAPSPPQWMAKNLTQKPTSACSSTTVDRFWNRQRPLSLGDGNRSSCPLPILLRR
jgi:hypothetical protein